VYVKGIVFPCALQQGGKPDAQVRTWAKFEDGFALQVAGLSGVFLVDFQPVFNYGKIVVDCALNLFYRESAGRFVSLQGVPDFIKHKNTEASPVIKKVIWGGLVPCSELWHFIFLD
jgi:hypothetical protein